LLSFSGKRRFFSFLFNRTQNLYVFDNFEGNDRNSSLLYHISISKMGKVCTTVDLNTLVKEIIISKFSYTDEFNNICYNYGVLVSKYPGLTTNDLSYLTYDNRNCSFTAISACIGKSSSNAPGLSFINTDCDKSK
jgi:hypothetical protein